MSTLSFEAEEIVVVASIAFDDISADDQMTSSVCYARYDLTGRTWVPLADLELTGHARRGDNYGVASISARSGRRGNDGSL